MPRCLLGWPRKKVKNKKTAVTFSIPGQLSIPACYNVYYRISDGEVLLIKADNVYRKSFLTICEIWGFRDGECKNCRRVGYDAV
jgi:hypothetical protein